LLLPLTSPGFILKLCAFSGALHTAHAETGEALIMVFGKDLISDIISQLSFFGKLAALLRLWGSPRRVGRAGSPPSSRKTGGWPCLSFLILGVAIANGLPPILAGLLIDLLGMAGFRLVSCPPCRRRRGSRPCMSCGI
jgi:hypothetical protein